MGVTVDLLSTTLNTGDALGDTFVAIENLVGSGYADTLRGDNLANVLQGINGNDSIVGRGGNDTIRGGAGNDTIYGQAGADVLYGDAGNDTFAFSAIAESTSAARDTIADFVRGQDRIHLSGIDANTRALLDQPFTFIGAALFTKVAGQLNFRAGIISGDVNGDGVADFQITLIGATALAAADFYL